MQNMFTQILHEFKICIFTKNSYEDIFSCVQRPMFYFTSPGKYCGSEGLPVPSGDCEPGYYCPTGRTTATPGNYSCDPGYFCVGGKEAQEACPSGTYQVYIIILVIGNLSEPNFVQHFTNHGKAM